MKACNEYNNMSRRSFLQRGTVAGIAAATMPAWLPKVAFADGGPARDTLIIIQLGGGIDGLSMCVPFGDPHYYVHRTGEAVPPPDSSDSFKAVNLDGFFGMHPGMTPLLDVYQDQKLLFCHATGAGKALWSRSHFDATRWLELGKPDDISLADGWVGRHLQTMPARLQNAPLRGITMTYGLTDTFRGGPNALPIPYPEYFEFDGWYPDKDEMIQWLNTSYGFAPDILKSGAQSAVNTVSLLQAIDFEHYTPSGSAVYPADSELARTMKATAAIIKANIGVEAIMIDFGGWDTHTSQGTRDGYFAGKLAELALNLKAFYTDMAASNHTDYVLMALSEFGRTVKSNESGHDHGTGNSMLFMGGSVIGGQVYRQWPGLADENLLDGQDLKVTIDYRDFLGEIVRKRLKNNNVSTIFPGYTVTERGIVAA